MSAHTDVDPNRGRAACAVVIAALEAELAKAARLRDQYASGAFEPAMLVPVRHLCATLVEAAIELARTVADLTAAERAAANLSGPRAPDGR